MSKSWWSKKSFDGKVPTTVKIRPSPEEAKILCEEFGRMHFKNFPPEYKDSAMCNPPGTRSWRPWQGRKPTKRKADEELDSNVETPKRRATTEQPSMYGGRDASASVLGAQEQMIGENSARYAPIGHVDMAGNVRGDPSVLGVQGQTSRRASDRACVQGELSWESVEIQTLRQERNRLQDTNDNLRDENARLQAELLIEKQKRIKLEAKECSLVVSKHPGQDTAHEAAVHAAPAYGSTRPPPSTTQVDFAGPVEEQSFNGGYEENHKNHELDQEKNIEDQVTKKEGVSVGRASSMKGEP